MRYLVDYAEHYHRISTLLKLRKKLIDIFGELCSNIQCSGFIMLEMSGLVCTSMFGLGSTSTAGTRGPSAPVVVWRRKMATFKYEAVVKSEAGEEHFERGYVVATSRAAAEHPQGFVP